MADNHSQSRKVGEVDEHISLREDFYWSLLFLPLPALIVWLVAIQPELIK